MSTEQKHFLGSFYVNESKKRHDGIQKIWELGEQQNYSAWTPIKKILLRRVEIQDLGYYVTLVIKVR